MARGELFSVLGLYQIDDSIFDNFMIPSELDKDVLVNNILLECAELEVLYPNPNVLKSAIDFWSRSRIKAWEDMKNVLIVENYRPFINLERVERGYDLETRDLNTKEEKEATSSSTETSGSTINRGIESNNTTRINSSTTQEEEGQSTKNSNNTNETNSTQNSTSSSSKNTTENGTSTNKVSAFNSNAFENKEQTTTNSTSNESIQGSEQITNESTTTFEGTETINDNRTSNTEGNEQQIANGTSTDETTSQSTTNGNVTTNDSSNIDNTGTIRNDYEHTYEGDSALFTKQNIIEQEMEIRLKYDLYKIIIDEFKSKFCLLIY